MEFHRGSAQASGFIGAVRSSRGNSMIIRRRAPQRRTQDRRPDQARSGGAKPRIAGSRKPAAQLQVFLDGQQYMRRPAVVREEHWAVSAGFLALLTPWLNRVA